MIPDPVWRTIDQENACQCVRYNMCVQREPIHYFSDVCCSQRALDDILLLSVSFIKSCICLCFYIIFDMLHFLSLVWLRLLWPCCLQAIRYAPVLWGHRLLPSSTSRLFTLKMVKMRNWPFWSTWSLYYDPYITNNMINMVFMDMSQLYFLQKHSEMS